MVFLIGTGSSGLSEKGFPGPQPDALVSLQYRAFSVRFSAITGDGMDRSPQPGFINGMASGWPFDGEAVAKRDTPFLYVLKKRALRRIEGNHPSRQRSLGRRPEELSQLMENRPEYGNKTTLAESPLQGRSTSSVQPDVRRHGALVGSPLPRSPTRSSCSSGISSPSYS